MVGWFFPSAPVLPECGLPAHVRAEASGQGRHHVVLSQVSRGTEDVSQSVEAGSTEGRTAQQDMPREVRFLVAHRAAGRWACAVVAARAGVCWAATDAVHVLRRAAPVASQQLMDVHRGLAAGAADRARERVVSVDFAVPAVRP